MVRRGTAHRLWNDGEDELYVLVEFRPALRTEEGFEQLFGLARDGKLSRRGFPHPLQIAVMAKEYRDEAQFPLVPTVVQRALIAPLAAIGVRRGYRAVDPRYEAGPAPPRTVRAGQASVPISLKGPGTSERSDPHERARPGLRSALWQAPGRSLAPAPACTRQVMDAADAGLSALSRFQQKATSAGLESRRVASARIPFTPQSAS